MGRPWARSARAAYAPSLVFFACLLLITSSLAAFAPFTEGEFKTYIDLNVWNRTVTAKISYFNMSYYKKPLPENYPDVYQTGRTQLPPEFFRPPVNPYSQDNFSVQRMNLENASVYFTVIRGNAVELPVSDGAGEICNPEQTNPDGVAKCTVEYFIEGGYPVSIDDPSQKTCLLVKATFMGVSKGGADFPPSSETVTICPRNSEALRTLGDSIAFLLSMPANVPLCFPSILLLSLLIASMYYAGRDPLSLFDITTPRLPKVRQFRVKAQTAPQMIRSVMRKYLQMQKRMEVDATKALLMAVKLRGAEQGKSREQILRDSKAMRQQVNSLFKDLNLAMKNAGKLPDGSAKGLTDQKLSELTGRLNRLFEANKPSGGKALGVWSRHYSAVTPFVQLYNATYQVAATTGEARSPAKSLMSQKISTPLFNTLTRASVRMEEMKGVRALGRIPIIKTLINTPTRTLDAVAQFRASRQGAIALRREIMGGAAFSLLRKTKTIDAARGLLGASSPVGKFFNWSHKWDFAKYEERHDLRNRKFKELFNPVDHSRDLSIDARQTMFQDMLAKLKRSLPTRENFIDAIRGLRESLDEASFKKIKDYEALKKRLVQLERDIAGMGEKGDISKYLKEYREIVASRGLRGEAFLLDSRFDGKWKRWAEWEDKFSKFDSAAKSQASLTPQADRLKELYNLARNKNPDAYDLYIDKKYGIDIRIIGEFRKHELNFMSRSGEKTLLTYLDNGIYRSFNWEDIRNEKSKLINEVKLTEMEAERQLLAKFGYNTRMKTQLEKDLRAVRGRVMDALGKGKDIGVDELTAIRDRINDTVKFQFASERQKAGISIWDRTDSLSMMRYNMLGKNAAGEALTRKLQDLGITDSAGKPIMVKDIREFELLFMRGTMSDDMKRKLEAAAGRVGLNQDQLTRKLMADTISFIQNYNVQNQKTVDIFFGSKKERSDALKDLLGDNTNKDLLKWLKPNEQQEFALVRVKFGYSNYTQEVETLLNMGRVFERASGSIIWGKRHGAIQGDSTLGLMESLRKNNREAMGILGQFHSNLTNGQSKFYDDRFTNKLGANKPFGIEAYDELLKRGYNFSDIKNGLGFMVSGDRRGGLPFLEHNKEVLAAYGYRDGIVRKGEVRDLTALVARMADSPYDNLPSGISVMIRHTDKFGNQTWVYGDPLKDRRVQGLYQQAKQDVTLDRNTAYGNQLSGYNAEAKTYNKDSQMIKVIATHDLREVRNNPGGFFGNVTGVDRFKERIRTKLHDIGFAFGEAYYSGTNTRASALEKWYAGQYQVRQALDAYEQAMGTYMTKGRERLNANGRISELRDASEKEADAAKAAILKDKADKMEEIMKGDGTFMGTANATWDNFRRNIFSKTVTEIAEAESKYYGAKLELKALERQHIDHTLGDREYARQRHALTHEIETLKSNYTETKSENKEFERSMRYWTSSHGDVYGSRRSFWTAFSPVAHFLDSKFVQGAKYDYYWITEAGVMRDPRTAVGAGFGLDYSFYVGYQTGQVVYERSRFYATNSLWEQQMRWPLNITLGAHKWFSPMVSQAMRDTSHYPSVFEMDALYPGQAHYGSQQATKHDLLFPMLLAPFRKGYSSDYWRTRFQYLLDYSGASQLIGAYSATSSGGEDPSAFKRKVDKWFVQSDHNSTEARFLLSQRTLDQFNQMDKVLEKSKEAREAYDEYNAADAGSQEAREALDKLSKHIKISDLRPLGVQRAVSGSDLDEDGSRNRTMNLYIGFHENIWKPTVPGMMDNDPRTGRWLPFPQVATAINRSEEGSRLDNLRNFNIGKYDLDEGRMAYENQFYTRSDAMRDVYKKESTALIHLMKYQNEMMGYALTNVPSILMFSPGLGAAFYYGVRNLTSNTKWGSAYAVSNPMEEYGVQRGKMQGFGSTFSSMARAGSIIRNNFHEFIHPSEQEQKLADDSLKEAIKMQKQRESFTSRKNK